MIKNIVLSTVVLLGMICVGCEKNSPEPERKQEINIGIDISLMPITSRTVSEDGAIVVRLENGMSVIVQSVHSSPVVCVRAYVHAGGMLEREYLGCGISHLTEHLVAEGAERNPGQDKEQVSDRIQKIGGQSNASTSMNWTQYYISAESSKTTECIDLISDWMTNGSFTREMFEREHGVVQRELERSINDPSRIMWRAQSKAIFGDHPVVVPVIGYASPLSKLKYEDVVKYHKRMYVPQNMVFSVVGDIDVEQTLKHIQNVMSEFKADRTPDLTLPEVKPIAGVIRTELFHPQVKEAIEDIAFQTVSLAHEDLYALDVLSFILTRGESSRLVEKIKKEEKLVTSISSSSWTPTWGKGVFEISFRSSVENADDAEKAILEQLRMAIEKPVTEKELSRAKRQKKAEFVYSSQTIQSQSQQLCSNLLLVGDVNFEKHYLKGIQSVSAKQVTEVAKKYFNFDRMVVTRMLPGTGQGSLAAEEKTDDQAKNDLVKFTLPNGLRVILNPNQSVGLVSSAFICKGGLMLENDQNNGLGSLLASLSTKGTEKLSAKQIAEFFANAGGGISGGCGSNTLYWQMSVLDDNFLPALDIFADTICKPALPESELDILKEATIAGIDRISQDRQRTLGKFFREKFFLDAPYSRMSIGTKKNVSNATPEKIAEFRKKNLLAGDCVLAIYGTFDAAATRKKVEEIFASIPKGKVKFEIPAPRKVDAGNEIYVINRKGEKAAGVKIGWPGMTLDNPSERCAIEVLDTIISGYYFPSGWLHDDLRGQRLVYAVHAYNWAGMAPGVFIADAECEPKNAPKVVKIILSHIARAAKYTPTQKEIDLAVNSILTAKLLENQTMKDLSFSAAIDTLYYGKILRGELEKMYRAVTPKQVAAAGRKYLSSPHVLTVITSQPELFDAKSEQPIK